MWRLKNITSLKDENQKVLINDIAIMEKWRNYLYKLFNEHYRNFGFRD